MTYDATVTAGKVNLTSRSSWGKLFDANSEAKGTFTKAVANVTGVQAIGHVTDVTLKLQGQASRGTLDSSEQMYLGGANGVRAYPQGEASGENGFLGSLEVRYHTPLPGLSLSTYFDTGHMMDKYRMSFPSCRRCQNRALITAPVAALVTSPLKTIKIRSPPNTLPPVTPALPPPPLGPSAPSSPVSPGPPVPTAPSSPP